MKRQVLAAIAAAGLLIGIGCSGGNGGGGLPSTPSQPNQPAAATAPATFTMRLPVPSTSAGAKKPAYISNATKSVSIAASGVPTETFNVSPLPSASCPQVGGFYVCTLNFDAPLGSTTLTVTTYDDLNGTGSVLSVGSVPMTIIAGTTNSVSVTLDGLVQTINLLVSPDTILDGGTPSTYQAQLSARDIDGGYIVGTSLLNQNQVPLSENVVSSNPTDLTVGSENGAPGAGEKRTASGPTTGLSWTVSYDGADLSANPPSLTLSAPGYANVVVTFTANPAPTPTPTASPTPTPTPSPTPTASPTPTPSMAADPTPDGAGYVEFTSGGAKSLTITEAGYNGNYTIGSDNGTVLSVDASPISSTSGSATLNVHANASGTANLTITDDNGQVLVVPVRVTISTVTIN